jgi:hypothetical protein
LRLFKASGLPGLLNPKGKPRWSLRPEAIEKIKTQNQAEIVSGLGNTVYRVIPLYRGGGNARACE